MTYFMRNSTLGRLVLQLLFPFDRHYRAFYIKSILNKKLLYIHLQFDKCKKHEKCFGQ